MEVFSIDTIDSIAARIIARVREQHARGVALSGNLGAGKTTLAQALGKALGVVDQMISPTFILMKRYETHGVEWKTFVHCDAYRIESEAEAHGLQLERYTESFICIEWPEHLQGALPSALVAIELSYVSEDKRGIIGL
jgi:tRNA threonylcarbamoyladenosine biosynthesis protein TsaE